MRLVFIILILLFLFPATAWPWPAQVVSVHDGDSLRVIPMRAPRPDKPLKIRLYGIDCPELGQPFGRTATRLTTSTLLGKTVEVEQAQKSRSYKRIVANVILDNGIFIQEELISAGLAWVDNRYCKASICKKWRTIQHEAMSSRRGLWSDPAAMPPWTWRKMKR